MSRIDAVFKRLKEQKRKGLIPFVTAGDPGLDATVPIMHALVEAGADILELGVPFSDPMAEGPVIQRASERALHNGTYLETVLDMVKTFRRQDTETAVVLMGYLNPIEFYGYEAFAGAAAEAGVDGVLTVDMPVEESDEYRQALLDHEIDPIFLLAPTSPTNRIEQVQRMGSGFVYYVSLKGVTGADSLQSVDVAQRINEIRQICQRPLAVGFGIKDAQSARQIGAVADAVVVGSAMVRRIEDGLQQHQPLETIIADIKAFAATLRESLDQTS